MQFNHNLHPPRFQAYCYSCSEDAVSRSACKCGVLARLDDCLCTDCRFKVSEYNNSRMLEWCVRSLTLPVLNPDVPMSGGVVRRWVDQGSEHRNMCRCGMTWDQIMGTYPVLEDEGLEGVRDKEKMDTLCSYCRGNDSFETAWIF